MLRADSMLLIRLLRSLLNFGPSNKETTINAQYQIDTGRNNGKDFQFHEVVRQKSTRKRMHGRDCECCHDVSVSLDDDFCSLTIVLV